MTPINLIHCLAKNISEVVKDYKFIAEGQEDKKVAVYEQYMPRSNFEEDTFIPCVTVALDSVEPFDKFWRSANVVITIGVFGGYKEDGWRDLLNLAEHISQFLYRTPLLDGDKFPRAGEIVFQVQEDQPEPFYFGHIAARFLCATPQI